MANANQIIVNGKTVLDLRSDTVTPATLQKGSTAHDKSGTKITGTLEVPATSGTQLSCVTDLGLLTFGYEVKTITVNGTAHEYVQYTSNAFSVSESLSFFPERLCYSICIPFPFPWHTIGGTNVFIESGFLYIWFTTDTATNEINTTGTITMGANIFTLMPMDSFPAESMPEGTTWFINCVKLINLDEENGTSYQIRFTLSVQDTRKLGILAPPDLVSGQYYLTTHLENVRGLLITYEEKTE